MAGDGDCVEAEGDCDEVEGDGEEAEGDCGEVEGAADDVDGDGEVDEVTVVVPSSSSFFEHAEILASIAIISNTVINLFIPVCSSLWCCKINAILLLVLTLNLYSFTIKNSMKGSTELPFILESIIDIFRQQ